MEALQGEPPCLTAKQLTAITKRLAKARTDVERKRNLVASRRSLAINDTETAHLGKSSVRVNGLKQKPLKKPKTNLTTKKAPRFHSAHNPIINRGETSNGTILVISHCILILYQLTCFFSFRSQQHDGTPFNTRCT